MQVLPDMSVKSLPGALQLDEVLQLAGTVVNWYHTKGPQSIKTFYGRHLAQGDSSKTCKANLEALGLSEGAATDTCQDPNDVDVELNGMQLSYISSVYNLAMAVEGYGRRLDSLITYEMLEDYLKQTVGEHHPISAVASVNIQRLKVFHTAIPLSERHQVATRMREIVAKFLWEHNVTWYGFRNAARIPPLPAPNTKRATSATLYTQPSTLNPKRKSKHATLDSYVDRTLLFSKEREKRASSAPPPPPPSTSKKTYEFDDSDCPITGPIEAKPGGFEFPYAHPCPGALLLGLAHAYAAVPPEIVEETDAAMTRRGEALRYTLYALSVIGSSSGENSWRVAAPLSLAVKLCKLGVCAGEGPALDKALEYAQRAAKVLGKALGAGGLRIKQKVGRGGGEGGGPRRAPSMKLLGGYTNIYMEYSAADLANAYVALAEVSSPPSCSSWDPRQSTPGPRPCLSLPSEELTVWSRTCALVQVERSKGMVTEAGQHFTMAGDILLRHSNETSNSVNGDKGGTRGGKDGDGIASSDKLGSSSSWPTSSGAARCPSS